MKKSVSRAAETENVRAERDRKVRLLIIVTCIGLSALAVVPFFLMGDSPKGEGLQIQMPVTHDMHLHYEQMKSFYNGLDSGEIYPRWEEDTNRGFGAPTMSYYPPGVYYLTSAFYAISGDWTRSILNLHLLMMIVSATGVYLYARRAMSRGAAVVAMISYIFLPYHLIDQYQRGAIAETLVFVWMPLMLLFAEKLFDSSTIVSSVQASDKRAKLSLMLMSGAGLAACLGAFLWSHPPTAYQFLLAFGLFALGLAWMQKNVRGLVALSCAIALGLALSAAYLYPAAVGADLIRSEHVEESWPYHETYVFVHNLSYRQYHLDFFRLIDSVWIFSAVMIALAAIILLVVRKNLCDSTPGLRQRVILWTVIGVFATFFMTKASYTVGRFIPKIDIGVFTWRMLSITTLVVALLAGACVEAAIRAQHRADRRIAFSLAGLILIGGIIFSISAVILPTIHKPVFSPEAEHFNEVMIPRTAPKNPRELPRVDQVELAEGKGEVSIEKWYPQHRVIRAELTGQDRLLIRAFNFPGWRLTVDGQQSAITEGEAIRVEFKDSGQALIRASAYRGGVPVVYGEETKIVGREPLGDIVLDLAAGTHHILLDYEGTRSQRAGGAITVVSLVVLIAVAVTAFVMRRRSRSAQSAT